MPPHARYEFFLSGNDSRLRPAQKLVAAEHHNRYARLDALPDQRFGNSVGRKIDETSRAKILDKRKPRSLAKRSQLLKRRLFRKSRDAEIGGVHAQEQPRFFVNGIF